jgi:acetyl esterase/lipase
LGGLVVATDYSVPYPPIALDVFLSQTGRQKTMSGTAASEVSVHRDIPFQRVDGEPLMLNLYDDPAASSPKPVAVLLGGGGFFSDDKGEFARHALDLATDGFLVIEPQYRLAPDHTFPAALVDLKAAIEWVHTEGGDYDAATDRIVGIGHSAGAILVVLAALTADELGFEPEL